MPGVYGLASDEILTATHTTPPMQAGTVIPMSNGNKYRLVYNYSATTSISQYSACYLYSASYNSWAVAARTNDGLGDGSRLAVGIAATLIGTQHYGWVCIKGVCTAYSTASIQTVGYACQPAGTGGIQYSTGADAAGNLAAQGAIFAVNLNTNTAAGTLLVNVRGI